MYSNATREHAKKLSKQYKSKHGVFFTPESVREKLFDKIPGVPKTILEPSAGTGEIISECVSRYPDAHVDAVELDEEMSNVCKTYGTNVVCQDFLTWSGGTYDLVVGNPPYAVCENKNKITRGRSNLYVEFLHKCLVRHLNPGGILAFVIPSGIGNSTYYEPTRKIVVGLDIVAFEILEKHDFCDTSTRLCILVVRNSPGTGKFVYRDYLCDKPVPDIDTTIRLDSLPVKFKTGHAWTNVKRFFVDSSDVPFITCENIKNNVVVLGPKTKYVDNSFEKHIEGSAILVKISSGGKRGGKFVFGFSTYYNDRWCVDNDIISIQGSEEDLKAIERTLKDERIKSLISIIANNGHMSMSLLKSLPLL